MRLILMIPCTPVPVERATDLVHGKVFDHMTTGTHRIPRMMTADTGQNP